MLTLQESQQLWEMVKGLEVGMLVSLNDDQLQSRPMHLVQKDFSGSFYFFTEIPSEKVKEIKDNQEVCLAFSCPKKQTYVSISGVALLNRDQTLIDQFWNPFVAAWFPQGKNDPSVGLIQIDAYKGEYWQGTSLKVVQLFNYVSALIQKKKPEMGEHKQLG